MIRTNAIVLLLVAVSSVSMLVPTDIFATEPPKADESLTIEKVLDAYKNASEIPQLISYEETAAFTNTDSPAPNSGREYVPPNSTVTSIVSRAEGRMKAELRTKWELTGKESTVPTDESHELLVSEIAVDNVRADYFLDHVISKAREGLDHRIDATTNIKAASMRLPGMILDGRLASIGGQHFADLIRESSERKMTIERDSEDQHFLYIVSASTPYGQCSLWIDPAIHFHPKRIELHKSSKDWIAPQIPISVRKMDSSDFLANDPKVEKIGDRYLMTHLRTKVQIKYSSGRVLQTDGLIDRARVDVNPSFTKGLFSIAAPNGTAVAITGNNSGIEYEWQNQAIKAAYPPQTVSSINEAVERVAPFPRQKERTLAWLLFIPITIFAVGSAYLIWRRHVRVHS